MDTSLKMLRCPVEKKLFLSSEVPLAAFSTNIEVTRGNIIYIFNRDQTIVESLLIYFIIKSDEQSNLSMILRENYVLPKSQHFYCPQQ